MSKKTVLVTGGAGFIGSALVRALVNDGVERVVNVDKLTYAGNLESLAEIGADTDYRFAEIDICDAKALKELIEEERPQLIFHLAAESHVDRSIDSAGEFIQTNVVGTFRMLDAARHYWSSLEGEAKQAFRFLHVSTDEVFGSLGDEGLFTEETAYSPNSPYSASKAGADHLARAWHHTFGMPVLITNCSNNYGPYQFPEKLIPVVILKALKREPIPVYGKGLNVRDWLFVDDHVAALRRVAAAGAPGQTYNIGGNCERTNIQVVQAICSIMDEEIDDGPGDGFASLITYVQDRPGHDLRYAIDASKIKADLGWVPAETFETGLAKTVRWYLQNEEWWQRVLSGAYRGERLGLKGASV
jgi:dTDP-glucose 4,6-dehydratase